MFADDTTKSSAGNEKQKKAKCDYEGRSPKGFQDPSSS